jgi:hypothetical protein
MPAAAVRAPGGARATAAAVPPPAGPARPAQPRRTRTGPAPKVRQPAPVPLPLLVVTAAAVVVVTVVCAVVIYSHIRHLARVAGMGSLAGWLPLGVDGLVVAASCSLIVDRQLGRPGQSPWRQRGRRPQLHASLTPTGEMLRAATRPGLGAPPEVGVPPLDAVLDKQLQRSLSHVRRQPGRAAAGRAIDASRQ